MGCAGASRAEAGGKVLEHLGDSTQHVRVSAALARGAVQLANASQLSSPGEFPGVEGEVGQGRVIVADDPEQSRASQLGTVVGSSGERFAAESLDAAIPVADHGAACRSFSAAS